jgi:chemotaxis protein methyltransferase CheR
MRPPVLPPPVFALFAALIEEKAGIHFKPADADILAGKLAPRAAEAGFESMLDYYYYLRYDPLGEAELDLLIDAVVVGETYFFREAAPLEALVREAIAPIAHGGRRARVWSAACASGEEPLTLAMLLALEGLLDRTDILASDLSVRALERARRGEYGGRSLRSLPPWVMGRFLHRAGDRVRVEASLARTIRWLRVNLLDDEAVGRLGTFDAILCRNVLIYFRDDTIRRIVCNLERALAPGGFLLVGVSESLLRFGTTLACEERGGAFFYRKRG